MKKDEILDAVGGIDPKYIEAAAEKVPARKKSWLRAALPAAAVLAAVLSLVLIRDRETNPRSSWQPGGSRKEYVIYEDGSTPEQRLLAAAEQSIEDTAHMTVGFSALIPVGNRVAVYDQQYVGPANVPTYSPEYAGSTEVLAPFVGEKYAETAKRSWGPEVLLNPESWYRVKDMNELKYLISRDEKGQLRLWKFDHFEVSDYYAEDSRDEIVKMMNESYPGCDLSAYTYGDVYRLIYQADGAEDIQSVTASAPFGSQDPTSQVYRISEEIGSRTITDRELLQQFFACTARAVSHGWNDWGNMGKSHKVRFTYSFSSEETEDPYFKGDYLMFNAPALRGGRWLTVTLKSGTTIDDWKYQALSGVLWQYGGIVSDPLPEEDVMTLNGLFGIE